MADDIPIPPPEWVRPLPAAVEVDGVRRISDVPYASELGYRPMRMNLHLPVSTEPVPLLLYVHGGAWIFGARDMEHPMYLGADMFGQFARRGIAVASIDYRLSSEAKFPAQLHDAAAALRYVVARAEELGIDTSRIAVAGESAGAHIATMLAVQLDNPEALGSLGAPVELPPLAAVVDWYGPVDLRIPITGLPLPGPSPEAMLIGAEITADLDRAAAASPIAQVGHALPPTLIVHGVADRVVPIEQSYAFADALKAAGTPTETLWIEIADHAWLGTPEAAREALDVTIEFLVRTLNA